MGDGGGAPVRSSRQYEAFRLIDRALNRHAPNSTDPLALEQYGSFLNMVMPLLDGDRAAAALGSLIRAAQAVPASYTGSLVSRGVSIELDYAESSVLALLCSSFRPGLTMKALEALPALKAKLDAVGGIDVLFQKPAPVQFRHAGLRGVPVTQPASGLMSPTEMLYRELRRMYRSDPSLARNKIREAVGGPDGITKVIVLARMAAHSDPDLAAMPLEEVRRILPAVEPLAQRALHLQDLIGIYGAMDGEVDPDLLRAGFILVAEMRREEAENESGFGPTGLPVAGRPPALYGMRNWELLESVLVGETARGDFDAALRCILPLPALRTFASLVAIVGALSVRRY